MYCRQKFYKPNEGARIDFIYIRAHDRSLGMMLTYYGPVNKRRPLSLTHSPGLCFCDLGLVGLASRR